MPDLQLADIDKSFSNDALIAIGDLTLKWAALDSAVTYWMIRAFGLPLDAGSILLGNMDTRTKLDKLHALHDHVGLSKEAEGINDLRNTHRGQVDTRNTVMHKKCIGVLRSDTNRLVFISVKHIKRRTDSVEMTILSLDGIKSSADFARDAESMVLPIANNMKSPLTAQLQQSI